ncbi:MAG: septum formation initiator family protein [Acidimicrobiales bacterium]
MRSLRRARLVVAGAVLVAVAVVATGFPGATIVRQRDALAAVGRQLSAVEAHNTEVRARIASMKQDSTIEAIAREEYGLVRPGQRSYVILPGKGDHAVGAGSLGAAQIPPGDVVPTSVSALDPPVAADNRSRQAGLWSRTLDELEFWRWAL